MTSQFWVYVEKWHEQLYSGHHHGPDGFRSIQYIRSLMEPNWNEEQTRTHPIAHELLWAANVQYYRLMVMEQKLRIASNLPGFDHIQPKLGRPDKYTDAMAEVEVAFRLYVAGLAPEFVAPRQDVQKPDLLVHAGTGSIWVEVTSVNSSREDLGLNLATTLFRMAGSVRVNVSGIIIKPKNAAEDESFLTKTQEAAAEASSSHRAVRANQKGVYTLYFFPSDLREEVPRRHSDGINIKGSAKRPHVSRILRTLEDKCQMEYGGVGYLVIFDRLMDEKDFVAIGESDSGEVRDLLQAYPQILGAVLITSRIGSPQGTYNFANTEASKLDVFTLPSLETEGLVQWENDASDMKVPDALTGAFSGFNANLGRFLSAKGIVFSGKY